MGAESIVSTLAGLAKMLWRGAGMILKGETAGMTMPAEGSPAPPFSVTAHDGTTVTLDRLVGRRSVVLFFFPKADTPG